MNDYLSKKIKLISCFSIIAVVFIHSYNYYDSFLLCNTRIHEGNNIYAMIEFMISNGIARFAVPTFFMISGYLFYYSFEASLKGYLIKLKKRTYSLFIPYIFWTLLAGLLIIIFSVVFDMYYLPIIAEHVNSVNKGGLIAWIMSPPAFQLWFVKELVIYTIISPIIFICNKRLKIVPIVVIAILWTLNFSYIVNTEGLLFFNIGTYLAINKKEELLLKKSDIKAKVGIMLWLCSCFIYTYISANSRIIGSNDVVLIALYKINVITGIIAVWYGVDMMFSKCMNNKILNMLSENIFIIYVLHEPLLHTIYQLILHYNQCDIVHIIIYILLPIVIIFLCLGLSIILRKLCPKVHKMLTGGR